MTIKYEAVSAEAHVLRDMGEKFKQMPRGKMHEVFAKEQARLGTVIGKASSGDWVDVLGLEKGEGGVVNGELLPVGKVRIVSGILFVAE